MNLPTNSSSYNIVKATKVDKKDILRFYKSQRYVARYIGQDQCYFIKMNDTIIACAMISAGQENGQFWLLHALVIDKQYRGNGLARKLIQTLISQREKSNRSTSLMLEGELATYPNIICFADTQLKPFYISNGFTLHNTNEDIQKLPNEFRQRLIRYQEKQDSLCCFLHCSKVNASSP